MQGADPHGEGLQHQALAQGCRPGAHPGQDVGVVVGDKGHAPVAQRRITQAQVRQLSVPVKQGGGIGAFGGDIGFPVIGIDPLHLGADLGAEHVDRGKALVGLEVPVGPAIAGRSRLDHRPDLVD